MPRRRAPPGRGGSSSWRRRPALCAVVAALAGTAAARSRPSSVSGHHSYAAGGGAAAAVGGQTRDGGHLEDLSDLGTIRFGLAKSSFPPFFSFQAPDPTSDDAGLRDVTNNNWSGYVLDIIHELAKVLHFKYKIVGVDIDSYSPHYIPGQKRGEAYEAAQNQSLFDVAVIQLNDFNYYRQQKERYVYTLPIMTYNYGALVKTSSSRTWWALFEPFTWKLWVVCASCVAAFSIGICIAERHRRYLPDGDARQGEPFDTGSGDGGIGIIATLFNALYYSVQATLVGGSDADGPKTVAGRIMSLGLAFFVCIFAATYTANLAQLLTTQQTSQSIATLAGLAKATACVESPDPYIDPWMQGIVQAPNVELYSDDMTKRMQYCVDETFDALSQAFVASYPALHLIQNTYSGPAGNLCNTFAVPVAITFEPAMLTFRISRTYEDAHKNSTQVTETLSSGIINMQRNGKFATYLTKNNLVSLCAAGGSGNGGSGTIDVEEMTGLFLICGGFLFLGLVGVAVSCATLKVGSKKEGSAADRSPRPRNSAEPFFSEPTDPASAAAEAVTAASADLRDGVCEAVRAAVQQHLDDAARQRREAREQRQAQARRAPVQEVSGWDDAGPDWQPHGARGGSSPAPAPATLPLETVSSTEDSLTMTESQFETGAMEDGTDSGQRPTPTSVQGVPV